jgi:2-hydroxychromene-2-carboxylate isomerase
MNQGAVMEKVTFYFDPRCPWSYQANRWARRLEELGEVRLDWGLYCLEVANLPEGGDAVALGQTARSATALRSAALIKRREDSLAMGRFYRALGALVWDTSDPAANRDQAVRDAVQAAGFDGSLFDEAQADPSTWLDVLAEHRALVEEKGGIGVPTIVLDGGTGPAIFGPVLSELPSDEDTVEIWKHLSWLARYENFFEMKQRRTAQPNLPGWKVPPSKLTFGSRPWMPPVPDPVPAQAPAAGNSPN